MDKAQQTSRRLVWSIIGVAVVVFIVISIILYILFGAHSNEIVKTDTRTSDEKAPANLATQEEVRNDIKELEAAMRRAAADQEAADSAFDDKKQVKLGS